MQGFTVVDRHGAFVQDAPDAVEAWKLADRYNEHGASTIAPYSVLRDGQPVPRPVPPRPTVLISASNWSFAWDGIGYVVTHMHPEMRYLSAGAIAFGTFCADSELRDLLMLPERTEAWQREHGSRLTDETTSPK